MELHMVSKEEIAQIINFSINNIQGKYHHTIAEMKEMEEMLSGIPYDNVIHECVDSKPHTYDGTVKELQD